MINIIQGDVIEVLKGYKSNSFAGTLSDPPYGLTSKTGKGGFMGELWDHSVPGPEYWAEILRVLKPGAPLLAFGGTRTWHRLACAIEDTGFELRDTLMWLHGQGLPKSYSIGKGIDRAAGAKRKVIGQGKSKNPLAKLGSTGFGTVYDITIPTTEDAKIWEGYASTLKPAWEPILLAMKSRDGTYVHNALKHHVAGLNIDECRIPSDEPYVINTWDDGANPFGNGAGHPFTGRQQNARWPANVILDETIKEKFTRYFYCAKANRKERNKGLDEQNPHKTVKPIDLCRYLATLIRPPIAYAEESTLLIPFAGSGSEMIGAMLAGWKNIIGIEISPEYCEIAEKRIKAWTANEGEQLK